MVQGLRFEGAVGRGVARSGRGRLSVFPRTRGRFRFRDRFPTGPACGTFRGSYTEPMSGSGGFHLHAGFLVPRPDPESLHGIPTERS